MSNTKVPVLSEDAASKLLENVFDACEKEPNTVPLKTLESYSEYRREKYGLQKVILIVILVIFLAVPFCFVIPNMTVQKISEDNARIPNYEIKVDGWFPVKVVGAAINGHNVTVYETGERTYSVEPLENGIMDLQTTFLNRQFRAAQVEVSGIDMDSPYLVSHYRDSDLLYLTVADDGLGIDYDAIYAETESGEIIKPIIIEKKTGEIAFEISGTSMNIYIPDVRENMLHLVITITN